MLADIWPSEWAGRSFHKCPTKSSPKCCSKSIPGGCKISSPSSSRLGPDTRSPTKLIPTAASAPRRDWIASKFQPYAAASSGRMNVTIQRFTQPPASRIPTRTVINKIYATLRGSIEADRVYVVSGHYDWINSDILNFTHGASGVAVSLEPARVVATHNPTATIIFAAVAREEQRLYGSDFMAKQFKAARLDIDQAMFHSHR